MSLEKKNLQDVFLNHVRKNKVPVTVFLVNGIKLQGMIVSFDDFCLQLRRDEQSQLIYKNAISTVMPFGPIQIYSPGDKNADHEIDVEDLPKPGDVI